MSIKSESYYRKCLHSRLYTNEIEKKDTELSDKNIYIMFDETTDSNIRYNLHILAEECCRKIRKRPILFRSVELERTNAATINQVILNSLPRKDDNL